MKRSIVIIFSIFLALISSARAQEEKSRKNGIRAGYHAATMVYEGSKPDSVNALGSFYIGFFRSTKIATILHFDSGIEYFQNGLKYSGNSKRTLHTISVPLDLRLKIGPVFAVGGAAANFKVSEEIKIGDNSYKPSDNNKSNWFDVAAFAGAGVKIWILTVEARYHWGLLETRNDLYSRYFQLGAAVSF